MVDSQNVKSVIVGGGKIKGAKESLLKPEALLNILEDLKEEKKKVEESEKKYELLFEGSQDAIFWADPKTGKIIKTNSAAEKLLERKKDEIIGMPQDELHPPEKITYYKEIFKQHVKEGRGLMGAEIITKLGKVKSVEINAITVSIGGRTIIQGIFRDITEKKKAENALRKSEENLQDAQEVAHVGSWTLDISKNILKWSDEVYRIFGMKKGAALTYEKFLERTHPEDRDFVDKAWKAALKGKPYDVEYRIIDGSVGCVREKAKITFDEKRKPLRAVGTVQDITEKRKAEVEIKRLNSELKQRVEISEEKYKTIYESSADAIMILEPPTWKFIAGNPSAIKMFGVKDEKQLISFGPRDISPEKQSNGKSSSVMAKVAMMKAMKEGFNFFEWTHKRLNGKDFPATVFLTRVNLNGKDVLQATVRDVTSQYEAKRKLEKANIHLKSLDRLKSMFIASMSHELRTPLNSIIGFTSIILQGMTGDVNPEQTKQLNMVKSSSVQLLSLINDIIDVSKIESEQLRLHVKNFDLSEAVQETKEVFQVEAIGKGQEIFIQMPTKLMVKGDVVRVKQIIINLLSNAIKFTEKGKIEIKVIQKDKNIEVSVKDEGIGIKKEDLDRLFKAFSRINERAEGVGLGLYLSKKLANLLGGDIFVKSEFGKGSVFTLIIPMNCKEVKE